MMDEEARNDFEKSLREAAEDFRVSPSDKVWQGVYKELHGARRTAPLWWAAAAFLLAAGIWGVSRYESNRPGAISSHRMTTPAASRSVAGPVSGRNAEAEDQRLHPASALNPGSNASGTAPAAQPIMPPSTQAVPASSPSQITSVMEGGTAGSSSFAVSRGIFSLDAIPFRPEAATKAAPGIAVLKEAPSPGVAWHLPAIPDAALTAPVTGTTASGLSLSPHRLSWGIYVTPAIGYRTFHSGMNQKGAPPLNMNPSPPGSRPSLNFITYQRQAPITYQHDPEWNGSLGVQLFYSLSEKWSLQSGLGLTRTGYQAEVYEASAAYVNRDGAVQSADAGRPVNSGAMSYASSAVTPKTSDFHIRYLSVELPVMVHRTLGTPGNVAFDLGAGAGVSYLAASKSLIFSPVSGRYFANKHYLRDVNTNLHLEASVVIPATRKMQLTAGPALQYQMSSTYRIYDMVKEHPYFVGLQVGLKWVR